MNRNWIAVMVGLWAGLALAQQPAPMPRIDDAKLLGMLSLPPVRPADRLYSPAVLRMIQQQRPGYRCFAMALGDAALGRRLAMEVPEERWAELIVPYAAFTMAVGDGPKGGKCPFCGQQYRGARMELEDFLKRPFEAKAKCCGATIYEHDADMPPDYKARPNHIENIPHLDGTQYGYRFYRPPGTESAPVRIGSDRRHWFCSASEVWRARMIFFHTENPQSVILSLAAHAVRSGDRRAYRALAAIYRRLAEVYPGLPLADSRNVPNGIALNAKQTSYLTAIEYRNTEVPRVFRKPDWFDGAYYNLDKLNAAMSWQDGVVAHLGQVIDVFELIRENPAVRQYSREKMGDDDEWERRVRAGLIEEMRFIARWSAPLRGGNTIGVWIVGTLKIGVAVRDPELLRLAVDTADRILGNHYFADGLSVEGAFNYGGMIRPLVAMLPVIRELTGIDLESRHPMLRSISPDDLPIRTLLGVESMHGDEHAWFFSGHFTGWKIPPDRASYTVHERSQCYPENGIACLRGGAPGQRIEAMLDFQAALGHAHAALLNVQFFHEGVNLMPDIGYACDSVDVTREPWSTARYPFEKLPFPPGISAWWAWYGHYATIAETHNTALVDGEHTRYPRYGPVTFQRFFGGQRRSEPGYMLQFAEADARGLFNQRPMETRVDVFHRQLATVTLPDGRSMLVDFFRIRGGKRHDLLWHAPANGPHAKLATSLGESQAMKEGSLNEYLSSVIPKRPMSKEGAYYIGSLKRWAMPQDVWQATWNIRPALFFPVTAGGRKAYQPWMSVLQDRDLRLWGAVLGSEAAGSEILEAKGPWPSKIWENFDGQDRSGVVAMKDAMQFLIESRSAAAPGLATVYAHVLEAWGPKEGSRVRRVEALGAKPFDPQSMGAGLKVVMADGDVVLVGSTHGSRRFASDELTVEGRIAAVHPASGSFVLYDGTALSASGGLAASVEAPAPMRIVGIAGDLTGRPGESALIVESARPLPTDDTLVGTMLTVNHQISELHTTGYTIERVSVWSAGRYRIDLKGAPPFIMHRLAVAEVDKADARRIKADYLLLKGQNENGLYTGRRIRFPRSGFECAMRLTHGGCHVTEITLVDTPPAGAVRVGDSFIIYQAQGGDEVVIPSHLACRGTPRGEELDLELSASGSATVTIPGGYARAMIVADKDQSELAALEKKGQGLEFKLTASQLKEGRARIILRK